jgi:hypothetical protein
MLVIYGKRLFLISIIIKKWSGNLWILQRNIHIPFNRISKQM